MKKLFQITEMSKGSYKQYALKMTTEELKTFLKQHRESFGYIAGVGGDKSYEIFAVEWTS